MRALVVTALILLVAGALRGVPCCDIGIVLWLVVVLAVTGEPRREV